MASPKRLRISFTCWIETRLLLEADMQKISRNVYVETGYRGSNVGFVVTGDGVVMIDSPQHPADAVKWREAVSPHGPVKYLINTEPHPDHTTGNYFFEGTVVAHEGIRQAMLKSSSQSVKDMVARVSPADSHLVENYRIKLPAITFSERLDLHLAAHTFHLITMPGHTRFQTAVHIPEERVVFTSDNIFGKVQAWMHEALPFEWLASLKKLAELDADVLVPGHGSLCTREYLPEMAAFIQDWIDAVNDAIKKGWSVEEAQDRINFIDRYPMEPGSEAMGQLIQKINVARLYQVLKS
jgi:cyclase